MRHLASQFTIGLIVLCQSVHAQLLIDPSFELTPVTGPGPIAFHTRIYTGQTFGGGWRVESGNVDVISHFQDDAHGTNSLDLTGGQAGTASRGTIYQDVPTITGQTYRLRFAVSGNPDSFAWGEGPEMTMRVWWGGVQLDTVIGDSRGTTLTNLGWEYHEYLVLASTNTTRLRFASLTGVETGPLLDDVSLTMTDFPTNGQAVIEIKPAVEITWASTQTNLYQVQWRADSNGPWQSLGLPIQGTGGMLRAFDSTSKKSQRFYRVLVSP